MAMLPRQRAQPAAASKEVRLNTYAYGAAVCSTHALPRHRCGDRGACADLRYLSGYAAHTSERLTCFVVPHQGEPFVVLPAFEASRLGAELWFGVLPWNETEDPVRKVMEVSDHPRSAKQPWPTGPGPPSCSACRQPLRAPDGLRPHLFCASCGCARTPRDRRFACRRRRSRRGL